MQRDFNLMKILHDIGNLQFKNKEELNDQFIIDFDK